MNNKVLNLESILNQDHLAVQISQKYDEWSQSRDTWLQRVRELRNYIFATDTKSTSNANLPWKNSTTVPKLTQLRDNLHANYMAALFPNDDWMQWEGFDKASEIKDKRDAIQAYMKTKVRLSDLKATVSLLVLDYIDYGNCFCTTEYVDESKVDSVTGETIPGYIGPKLFRISPHDIVFDCTGSDFYSVPKIKRTVKSLGALKKQVMQYPEDSEAKAMFQHALNRAGSARQSMSGLSKDDVAKLDRFKVDGFGSMYDYFMSGEIEILQFYGDIYDVLNDKLYEDHIITVIDKSYIAKMEPSPSWTRKAAIKHAGWRSRQDNLYAMGPLDNLVGMQYRIDHLENLKADVFDLIAFPMFKIKGNVEDFEYKPAGRIYIGDEGDVTFMSPDTTALNADLQIRELENKMEELAGAPRQAMGIRTPGEKTKYEVQTLENATGRIFQNKVAYFESNLIEPALNDMLELARRNISGADLVRTMGDDFKVVSFLNVTKEDITANGKLRARGAQHFAKEAMLVQNLTSFANSSIGQDPAVNVHISGLKLAKLFEEVLDIDEFELVQENIRVMEQQETQRMIQQVQDNLAVEAQTPTGLPGDEG